MLCTPIENGRDSCNGDSGSAMIRYDDERGNYVQVGIVSSGPIICGANNTAAVYVRVEEPKIREFIKLSTGV